MIDRPIRASDQERQSVVDVLRDAFTDGRLTLDEFEERMTAAYAAKTWTELRQLTGDLPVEPLLGTDLGLRPQSAQPHVMTPPADPPQALAWLAARPVAARRVHLDLIAAAAGSPDTAAALSVVFICLLACRVGYGGRW